MLVHLDQASESARQLSDSTRVYTSFPPKILFLKYCFVTRPPQELEQGTAIRDKREASMTFAMCRCRPRRIGFHDAQAAPFTFLQ